MTDKPAADPGLARATDPASGPGLADPVTGPAAGSGLSDLAAHSGEAGAAGPDSRDLADDDDPDRLPPFSEQLADQLGGIRGVIESGVPVLVFVIANVIWSLRPALVIAIASAVAIAVTRLARKQPVRHAINGLFGVGIGAIIAWKTGSAKNFYLPGILMSFGISLAMMASVPFRVPLVGWIWSLLAAKGSMTWREDRGLVRTFSWLTVVWAATYLAKTLVQAIIFHNTPSDDPGTTLGIARLALGYPPYAILLALTVWRVRKVTAPPPA